MRKGRPQPSVVYEHDTADALHLCLYACHTVLQPLLLARHRKDKEMIKTATAAGMGKWVQMTFAWASNIFQAQYGRGRFGNPLTVADHSKLRWLTHTVLDEGGKGKASRWKQWFQGFYLNAEDLYTLKKLAYTLVLGHIFDIIADRDVAEQGLPAMGEWQKSRSQARPKRKNEFNEERPQTPRKNRGRW